MSRIISVANQKGGVGKTTTAVNVSAALAEKGHKILAIDADPQGNLSSGLGINKNEVDNTLYDVLLGECHAEDAILKSEIENLYVMPSNVNLAGSEIELIGVQEREYLLKNILSKYKDIYDYIVIDCPPSLNILTLNAFTATDSVLIPVQCEFYALEGLSQLMHTIELVRARLNENIKVEGLVFTMFDSRTNLSLEVVEQVKHFFKGEVFQTIVPRNVRLAEAPSHGQPITVYDSKSRGAEAYRDLAEEIENNID